nr:protein m28 [Mastomys natalensis cytomegalovirus 3]WEG69861.1 protein m28 [Mastomys natalensis cytomegalovirus 3]WEG70001.1 protein m28 [Mastomys natalensis cytomegalovirus 3]WEG70141.1 protein m28 [Mastomys natalensis cytomegalovirus 3]WEG70281.1 protein m28 [Mastomys natalensis cytomegalovirus 3]
MDVIRASTNGVDSDSDDVFVRNEDESVTFVPDTTTVPPAVGTSTDGESVRSSGNGSGAPGLRVVIGTARRLILDDSDDIMDVNSLYARGELLRRGRLENKTAFEDVCEFVAANTGRTFGLDHDLDVKLVIGNAETMDPPFDVQRLLNYLCTERSYAMSVIGKITFGSGTHGNLVVVYTGGDRCYVHSEETDMLYIVSDRGIGELLSREGHRHIYEMFDRAVEEDEDGGIPLCMLPLAMFRNVESVADFVKSRVGMSTFRQTTRVQYNGIFYGYFMIGDEDGLKLGNILPSLVFWYLKVGGYRVLGRTEMELIVLYNEKLEVFILLDGGRVLKVANTIAGFLRDRLRSNLQPYRRAFANNKDLDKVMCVGEVTTFRCDVSYVIPGGPEFSKWLASNERPLIIERCDPIL